MLTQPLQFEPGTRYAYSNFKYFLLGRVIERVSGMRYEQYVRERVFKPTGVQRADCGSACDGATMLARPQFVPESVNSYYGMGWQVERRGAEYLLSHTGQAPGTYAFTAWINSERLAVVVVFNSSPRDEQVNQLAADVNTAIGNALQSVTNWPTTDLFPSYYPQKTPRIAGIAHAASGLGANVAPGEIITLCGANLGPMAGVGSCSILATG